MFGRQHISCSLAWVPGLLCHRLVAELLEGQDSCWPRTRVLPGLLDGILSLESHVRVSEPVENKIPPLLPPWGHCDIV